VAQRRRGSAAAGFEIPSWAQALAGSLFGAVQQNVEATGAAPRRMLDQLGQWVGHLSQNAAVSWAPSMLTNENCSFCSDISMSRCFVCGAPCCLGHGHVSFRAEIVCEKCIAQLVGEEALRDSDANKTAEQRAFKYFNLTDSATFDEVNAIFRARAKTAHPDKGGSTPEMAKASEHLMTLKRYFDKKAAA
jgi:hypothetical protein